MDRVTRDLEYRTRSAFQNYIVIELIGPDTEITMYRTHHAGQAGS